MSMDCLTLAGYVASNVPHYHWLKTIAWKKTLQLFLVWREIVGINYTLSFLILSFVSLNKWHTLCNSLLNWAMSFHNTYKNLLAAKRSSLAFICDAASLVSSRLAKLLFSLVSLRTAEQIRAKASFLKLFFCWKQASPALFRIGSALWWAKEGRLGLWEKYLCLISYYFIFTIKFNFQIMQSWGLAHPCIYKRTSCFE